MPKTWSEKLNNSKTPKVELLDKPMMGLRAGQRLLVTTPLKIKAAIESVPKGTTMSVADLRSILAHEAGADATCPTSTGIFVWIVAESAWDEHLAGKPVSDITPFWRVVDPGSKLAAKLRCGEEFIVGQRALEQPS